MSLFLFVVFFFNDTATTEIYTYCHTLSLPDALPSSVAFMFPGGGAQYVNMARDLYRTEPTFATHVDHGFRLLAERHGLDLAPLVFCVDDAQEAAAVQQIGRAHV